MTVIETASTDQEATLLAHLRRAMDALRAGDIVLAAGEAESARALGQTARVLMVFAAISHAVGRDADALAMLDQAMNLEPSVGNYPDAMAAIYLKLGRKADGLFNLKLGTHLSSDPFLSEIFGDYFGSIKSIFDSFIENRPLKTAKLLIDQGMYSAALKQLETFIAVSGGDIDSFALIAESALRLGNTRDSEVALEALRALDSDDERLLDLEFRLSVLKGDEVEIQQSFAKLPAAMNLQQSYLRARAMVSSPYFESLDIENAYTITSGLIPSISDIDPPNFNVSTDLLSIGFFVSGIDPTLESLLLALKDRVKIKIYCLGTGHSPSQQRLKNAIDDWRDVASIDDATLTEMVRYDDISILFDCAILGPFSRPAVVRARVAPVQIVWQTDDGYDDVASYDYRLTDKALEPKASGARVLHLNTPLRYPLPPAELMGRVTELRLQNTKREEGGVDQVRLLAPHAPTAISPALLGVWLDILVSVPEATLTFIAPTDLSDAFVHRILIAAEEKSVVDRVDLIDPSVFMTSRHDVLLDSDLILDSFPRNNFDAMTEALWIGCLILTVSGDQPYASLSASLARSADLPELIAQDEADYRARAIRLATHLKDRKALKAKLKQMHQTLTLSVYEKTAEELFQKLDALWQESCKLKL
jgi:tetratricopeptide (TPR) repeat protein